MPVGYRHLRYRDFKTVLAVAQMESELDKLEDLERKEKDLRAKADALRKERITFANHVLETHYNRLRFRLRPCHQRRFDKGPKEVEPEAWL